MSKHDELYGLSKVPDEVLLKAANVEIGKLKAYIAELEDRLQTPEGMSLAQLKKNNKTLTEENRRLRQLCAQITPSP